LKFEFALLIGLFVFSAFFLFGYVSNPKDSVFTYGEPTTLAAAPLIIAKEKGFWQEEGLNVNVARFSSGRLALDSTINGNIQANSVSETPPMLAILNGNKIFVVATAGTHHETKFIGRKDKGILEPKDLKGKKIANLPGTNSDYFMAQFLKANGLAKDDLQIITMQPPEMINALVRGDIDGFFAWEPHIYYAEQTLKDTAIVFDSGNLYNGFHTIIMRQDFVESNPIIVEKFLKGILKAEDFIKNNREESVKIVSKHLDMKEEVVNQLFDEYDFKLELNAQLADAMSKEADWAIENKISNNTKPVNFFDYIYTNALKSIKPDSVSIQ